jgi:hypothetical protein
MATNKTPFPEEEHLPSKEKYTTEDINTIDVFWCKDCLSLNIRRIHLTSNTSYCDDCFCTNIMQGPLEERERTVRLRSRQYLTKKLS